MLYNIVENPLAGSSDSTLVETPQTAGHLTTTQTRFASKPKLDGAPRTWATACSSAAIQLLSLFRFESALRLSG